MWMHSRAALPRWIYTCIGLISQEEERETDSHEWGGGGVRGGG
jgi:hypothetical protein